MSEAVADESKIFRLKGETQLKLSTAEDAAPYVAQIEAIDDLQEVHFGGNSLGTAACVAFAEALKKKTTLRVADFADIFTGRLIDEIPDALRALCNALLHHEHLDELDLSDNAFGGRSAEPMVELLSNNHSIKVLKLNNNGLGIDGGCIVSGALTVAAKKLADSGTQSQLHTVICGRNRLENGSAPQWAEAFAAHKTLRVVRMYQNGIRMEGIQAIVAGLRECKDLEWLDLCDNTATLKGSIAIATSLPSWPKLQTLDLTDCLLRPRGGVLVANALAKGHNTELKKLQLGFCELDSKALSALAKAITLQLSNLTELEINGNFADEEDDCIEAIKSALEEHGHLNGLDDLDDLDPEGEIDDSEDEASDEESGETEEEETGAVAAGVPTADQDTSKVPSITNDPAKAAAAAVAAPAATAAVAGTGIARAVDNLVRPAEEETSESPEQPKGGEAEQSTAAFEPITDATQPESTATVQDVQKPEAEPSSSAADPQVPALVAVAEPEAQDQAETIEEAAEAKGPQTALHVAQQDQASQSEDAGPTQTTESQANEVSEKLATLELGDASAASTEAEPQHISQGLAQDVEDPAEAAATTQTASEDAEAVGDAPKSGIAVDTAAEVAETVEAAPQGKVAAETVAQVAEAADEAPEPQVAAETAAEVAEAADEAPEPQVAADTAAEVAEAADEAPEPQVAAETAAEVAESAQEVPESKVAAENASEVADSAQDALQPAREEAIASVTADTSNDAAISSQEAHKPQSDDVGVTAAKVAALSLGAVGATQAASSLAEHAESQSTELENASEAEAPVIAASGQARGNQRRLSGGQDLPTGDIVPSSQQGVAAAATLNSASHAEVASQVAEQSAEPTHAADDAQAEEASTARDEDRAVLATAAEPITIVAPPIKATAERDGGSSLSPSVSAAITAAATANAAVSPPAARTADLAAESSTAPVALEAPSSSAPSIDVTTAADEAPSSPAMPVPVAATSGAFGAGIGGAANVYSQLNGEGSGATASADLSVEASPALTPVSDVGQLELRQERAQESLGKQGGHAKKSSVDLSGELFTGSDYNAQAKGTSSSASGANQSADAAAPRKSRFRAAMGAIRELLR